MGLTVAEYAREFRAGDRRIVQHFKWLLTTAPVLVIPRVGKYVLCSDACDTGCGGMHLKLPCTRTGQPGGVLVFFAKSYSSAELRYHVTEKALLALIIACASSSSCLWARRR